MDAKKSRHRKFRGRTYIDDLTSYLKASDWDRIVSTIKIYADDEESCLRMLSKTELHRIDVDHDSSGMVNFRWNRIDIHTQLFQSKDDAEFFDTLFHEVAHLIAYYGCDYSGHGVKWRRIFADLGYPSGERCHSLGRLRGTTGKLRTRTMYVYECLGCGREWHTRKKRHAPECWHHRKCPGGREKGYRFLRQYKEVL